MADLQKALNDVYAFLKAQGRCSIGHFGDDYHGCAYRGSYGAKCAAGFFISDDDYHSNMESHPVTRLAEIHEGLFGDLPTDFLLGCQLAHDACECAKDFRRSLRFEFERVANEFNLTLSE